MQSKDKTKTKKLRRAKYGARNVLTVTGGDPAFKYRVANEDNVARYESLGYEVDRDPSVKVGDRTVGKHATQGSAPDFSVGQGTRAVVMRIPVEDWEALQEEKAENNDDLENSTRVDAKNSSDYGKVDVATKR